MARDNPEFVKEKAMKKYLGILCSFILILTLTACGADFDGSRTGNDSQFIMEYTIFNTTDSQSLELETGDIIEADIVNNAGSLSITIQKDENKPIYENKNVSTSTFEIKIEESGTYKITVSGEKTKGSVSFIKSTSEEKITGQENLN